MGSRWKQLGWLMLVISQDSVVSSNGVDVGPDTMPDFLDAETLSQTENQASSGSAASGIGAEKTEETLSQVSGAGKSSKSLKSSSSSRGSLSTKSSLSGDSKGHIIGLSSGKSAQSSKKKVMEAKARAAKKRLR